MGLKSITRHLRILKVLQTQEKLKKFHLRKKLEMISLMMALTIKHKTTSQMNLILVTIVIQNLKLNLNKYQKYSHSQFKIK